jgi:hypothetical protein
VRTTGPWPMAQTSNAWTLLTRQRFGPPGGLVPRGDRWTRWYACHEPCPWPAPTGQGFRLYRLKGGTEWLTCPLPPSAQQLVPCPR